MLTGDSGCLSDLSFGTAGDSNRFMTVSGFETFEKNFAEKENMSIFAVPNLKGGCGEMVDALL